MDNIYKKGIIVVGVILMTLILFLGYNLSKIKTDLNDIYEIDNGIVSKMDSEKDSTDKLNTTVQKDKEGTNEIALVNQSNNNLEKIIIKIDVDGAVNKPGVYDFESGSTVIDAINTAGGLTDSADTKCVNRARELINGEKIYIPEKNENIVDLQLESYVSNKININIASKEQLMTLNGIGEVYAQRIIEYRNKNKFSSVVEIKEVKGIGEKTFEKIEDDITI